MAKLSPSESATAVAIYAAYKQAANLYHSHGLSVSSLGEECDRKLWYAFRHAYAPEAKDGRILRLFETGEREEVRMLDDLRKIGVKVTNEQARVDACNGHLRGRIDAECDGLPEAPKTRHIVECKTHNDKNFKALSSGVLKGKYSHYVQLQIYMHLLGATRGLYLACNKNDESLYCERVEYDPVFCAKLIARAQTIIDAPRPPVRLHDDPASRAAWACTYCPARALCHESALPEHNCRTCLHSTPVEGANWICALRLPASGVLTREEVATGCPRHLYIPDLVPGEQVDADEALNTVTYHMPNGNTWIDGLGRALGGAL